MSKRENLSKLVPSGGEGKRRVENIFKTSTPKTTHSKPSSTENEVTRGSKEPMSQSGSFLEHEDTMASQTGLLDVSRRIRVNNSPAMVASVRKKRRRPLLGTHSRMKVSGVADIMKMIERPFLEEEEKKKPLKARPFGG